MNHLGKFILAVAAVCIVFLSCTSIGQENSNLPYMNPKLSPEQRAADLVHRMTLEEKASMLAGSGWMESMPIERLGIPAIKMAVSAHDLNACAELVKDLDSDDPAVRFYAIEGLQKLTGESFSYRYYDDETRRVPALKKWQQWLAEREGTTKPAAMGAATP